MGKCRTCGKEVNWDKDNAVICDKCFKRIWGWEKNGVSNFNAGTSRW